MRKFVSRFVIGQDFGQEDNIHDNRAKSIVAPTRKLINNKKESLNKPRLSATVD